MELERRLLGLAKSYTLFFFKVSHLHALNMAQEIVHGLNLEPESYGRALNVIAPASYFHKPVDPRFQAGCTVSDPIDSSTGR
jgi:hypothetical protein